MPVAQSKKPTILDVLISVMVDPQGITKRLFAYDRTPPWVITTLILFITTCVVAPLMYTPSQDSIAPGVDQLGPCVLTTLFTLVGTWFLLVMALHALNLRRLAYRIFSGLVYATAPFITLLTALLITNKILYGNLSLLGVFGFGLPSGNNLAVTIFPIAMRLAALLSFLILSQSLRAITNSSRSLGILLALSAFPLLLGSFVIAVTVTDMLFPGSSSSTISFFSAYITNPT